MLAKKTQIFSLLTMLALSLGIMLVSGNAALAQDGHCHGRMTGGGVFISQQDEKTRVTYGFELHCDETLEPNRLEINWTGNRFHLESVSSIFCVLDANVQTGPQPPAASFNTLYLTGAGRYNGTAGYNISITLVDAGEPGKKDTATFVITDSFGNYILRTTGTLTVGNNQAHNSTGNDVK
jgi:hypothetical protein